MAARQFGYGTMQEEAALEIGLRYSSDQQPGISRRCAGNGFEYLDENGQLITSESTLERISALTIPPAWRNVWICRSPKGYLQATGKDAKGRKQSIYHSYWRAHQSEAKFKRLAEFGQALPRIRTQVEHDLAQHGLPESKVIAALVRLLERSLIRIGNRQYALENHSFGLTTMENRHVAVSSTTVKFSFKGKSGKFHQISLSDRRLASIVKRCQELPGQRLFEYLESDLEPCEITSTHVNEYIREAAGLEFTAKDFRTWAATVEAVRLIRNLESPSEQAVKDVIKIVAGKLGNTPAVCRDSYIHPAALVVPADWWSRPNPRASTLNLEPIERFVLKHVLS